MRFCEAITACGTCKQWQMALGILGWMKSQSFRPDLWSGLARSIRTAGGATPAIHEACLSDIVWSLEQGEQGRQSGSSLHLPWVIVAMAHFFTDPFWVKTHIVRGRHTKPK